MSTATLTSAPSLQVAQIMKVRTELTQWTARVKLTMSGDSIAEVRFCFSFFRTVLKRLPVSSCALWVGSVGTFRLGTK